MKVDTAAQSSSAELILDAAEKVFAERGYEGASMRQIADAADIAQALLHYHFHTKDRLYEAVFERRSTVINAQRRHLLNTLFAGTIAPTIEDVLKTYYEPVMSSAGAGNAAFAQMVASLTLGNDERATTLITKYYDPIAREYIAAFRKVEPGLSDAMATWVYLLALGARTHVSPVSKRAERLSDGACRTSDFTESLSILIEFVTAGIKALAVRPPNKRIKSGKSRKQAVSSAAVR